MARSGGEGGAETMSRAAKGHAATPDGGSGFSEGVERPAFAEERQEQIEEMVRTRGRVRLSELVAAFGVTEPTLRKDLTALEKRGALKRIHGGALAARPALETELEARDQLNASVKDRIAEACVAEIKDGDAIFLDSGSTVSRIARLLTGRRLMVLTNAVEVATRVCEMPGIDHVLLGGQYRRVSGSNVGPLAIESLERFTVNIGFLGASGVGDSGITVADPNEAALKAAVIERSRRVVVAADGSKIGAIDFARVCSLADVDVLVTDSDSDDLRASCAHHGVELRSVAVAGN